MATLHLTAATTVADLRKEFNEAFGSQVKVYIGNKGADMSSKLGDAGLSKSGDFECRSSLTVATFIERMKEEFGLKVKVYTCDEWVAALDALTLEQSGKVKKAATKADMEKIIDCPQTTENNENAIDTSAVITSTENKSSNKMNEEQLAKDIEKLINSNMVYVDATAFEKECIFTEIAYSTYSYHPNNDGRRKLEVGCKVNEKEKPLLLKCNIEEFLISKFLVSQKLWTMVMGTNPSTIIGDEYPVNNITLIEAQAFIKRINQLTLNQYQYAIPSEYQWEWAAKGAVLGKGCEFSGSNNIDEVAWYDKNSNGSLQKIGLKLPNELGIYDMSGLLGEWTSTRVVPCGNSKTNFDSYDIQCREKKDNIEDNTLEIDGNSSSKLWVEESKTYANRGGYYNSRAESCIITHRSWSDANQRNEWNGLRIISRVPENYERPVRQLVKQQENSKPISNSESKGFISNVLKKVFG